MIHGKALGEAYKAMKGYGLLTAEEVKAAVRVTKSIHPDKTLQFIEVNCVDPSKQEIYDCFKSKSLLPRAAEVISMCLSTNETLIDIVDLNVGVQVEVIESKALKDVQAGISPDEYTAVEIICKEYQPLLDAVAARGLDPQYLVADAWCVGHTGPQDDPTERYCWPALYYMDPNHDDLPYARPIEGIDVRISLSKKQVVSFEDKALGVFPIPGSYESKSHYYTPDKLRKDLKPILITQPQGPSWTISHGNVVYWQKWQMNMGFNSREGLTLHGITYEGRPIMHRFSVCEMVVPYGDPRPPHSWKNAFDGGEDGLGRNANSLVLGCDCLGVIHYTDAHLVKDDGDVYTIKNAICLHEEDASIAWKHTDWRTGVPRMARNRKLVLSFICTIANYEYGFYYNFYLDGSFEVDVKLTGVLSTGAYSYEEMNEGGVRKYGIPLGGTLYTPVHQHFFVARMDFAVDGVENTVTEWNAEVETAGPHNLPRNAFYFVETSLRSELEGCRHCNSDSARFWTVKNFNVKNSIGQAVGFKIAPQGSVKPFAPLAEAAYLKRAQFLDHQVWVTKFNKKERYPAGDFPNQSPVLDGLPVWIKRNHSIDGEDLVFWHVFGVTHCPRPEEWPIMPVEHCGFKVMPFGFFDHSPAMDIPSSITCHEQDNVKKVQCFKDHGHCSKL